MITYYVLKLSESNYKIVNSTTHEIDSNGKLVKRKEPIFNMRRLLVSWNYDEILKTIEELEIGEYRILGTF